MEVLCLEEWNELRGMRYLSNNNLIANKETGESLKEIYVTQCCLVTQYNFLEFINFGAKKFTPTFNSIVNGGFIYGKT